MIDNIILIVEGGIGHHFNYTPCIKKIKEDNKTNNLTVIAAWPDVFLYNPYIDHIKRIDDTLGITSLYKEIRKKGNFKIYNPSVYRENHNISEAKHIKEIIANQCEVSSVTRSDFLEYYPTIEEEKIARQFKKELTKDGKYKLGIVQINSAGFNNSPLSLLKNTPKDAIEEVLLQTKDKIKWVQVRLKSEEKLENTEHDLVDIELRALFMLISLADLGIGVDSFVQHIMAGVCDKPFYLLLGRSRYELYGHNSTIEISNPDSCEYFGCEFPFISAQRLCAKVECMSSITSKQILEKLNIKDDNHDN